MPQKTSGSPTATLPSGDVSTRSPTRALDEGNTAEGLHGLTQEVMAGAQEVSNEVKHLAGNVAGQARKQAETTLSSGKDRAAQGIGSVAGALRKAGDQLRSEDNGSITGYVTQAADQVDRVSAYLQSRTLGQIMGDTEDFARREPALFLGGAFVVGLLGGRFLKSATPHRPRIGAGHTIQGAEHDGDHRASAARPMVPMRAAAPHFSSEPRDSIRREVRPVSEGSKSSEARPAAVDQPRLTRPSPSFASPSAGSSTLAGTGVPNRPVPGNGTTKQPAPVAHEHSVKSPGNAE